MPILYRIDLSLHAYSQASTPLSAYCTSYNLPALSRLRRCLIGLCTVLLALCLQSVGAQSSAPVSLGPDRGWIIALAAAPGAGGVAPTIWAASNGGRVFRSTDGGTT
jgi:hypothetical protein